jgi:hypothetical protein
MKKAEKLFFVCMFLIVKFYGSAILYGQEDGDFTGIVNKTLEARTLGIDAGNKFTFNLALYVDAFRFEQNAYGHAARRKSVNDQNTRTVTLPFTNPDWVSDDSNISARYESDWVGGKYTFNKSNITNFGAVQGWVKFGNPDTYLKVIAGNDNDSTYADSLGADPGLRIYTGDTGKNWQATRNPDNITQGNGLVLNGVLGNLTLDFAGSRFNATPQKTQTPKPGTVNTYGDTENIDFQYGGRIGYRFGDFGRVNASYILEYSKLASKYGWDTKNLEIVATAPDAEIFTHYFGVYGTVTPIKEFGVTLGYSGIITKYLDQYWSIAGDMDTTFPFVWKHAVNLNLRYNGLLAGALRLRTDNSMTIHCCPV